MSQIKLYEQLIDETLKESLKQIEEEHRIHTDNLEPHASSAYFATYVEHVINHAFRHLKETPKDLKRQMKITNQLIEIIGKLVKDDQIGRMKIVEEKLLRGVTPLTVKPQDFKDLMPQTSIARSSLFTGNVHEPQVYSELKREIASADRIDLLVSFIKHSGLRLLYDELVEHTKTKPLRVITTSYMGASDYKAIKMLAELPNTEVKVSYDTERTRLHAKAYYFQRDTGFSTAYIGSSNLSKAALSEGTEWNLKISEYLSPEIIQKYAITFETYWHTSEFVTFDPNNLEETKKLKKALTYNGTSSGETYYFDLAPFAYQQEILDRLEIERDILGSHRNLLVAATGTGKTMISAFDFKRFKHDNPNASLLFLAHREEILKQSLASFRGVLRDNNFGELWVSQYQPTINQQVFASIQTLNSKDQYLQFKKDHFDYIVLDETHHAAAKTYKRLLDYFEPKILLGLTATPERLDGENILEDFNHRVAYEIRLGEAIQRNLLCPFHYFAVTDATDLSQVKWQNGKYDTETLNTKFIGNIVRDNAIVKALDKYLPDMDSTRGLAFCASRQHASYMAKTFNERGIPSMHLDGQSNRESRESAQEKLKSGEINFIFVVDLYNEGIDIPEVNTVLFLRPTESPTIFTQQLGRGLRLHPSKSVLTVLDFIGQANKQYDYSMKFQSLLGRTKESLQQELENDFPSIPRNCVIQFERVAKDYVLKNLNQHKNGLNRFRKLIINYNHQSANALTVGNFLDFYRIKPTDFYKSTTLESLALESGVSYGVESNLNRTAMTKAQKHFFLYKLSQTSAYSWLKRIEKYLTTITDKTNQDHERDRLILFYMLPKACREMASIAFKTDHEYLKDLFMSDKNLRKETLEVIDYLTQNVNHIPKAIGEESLSLELHATYSVDQILAIFGEHTFKKQKAFREGVLYVKKENTDLFFITLNKSDKQFSETTMYDDYAINERLFHWQTQSRTSETSKTGQRYIKGSSKVILFVRDHKKDNNGKTATYTCLGYAKIVSHTGSSPISITYALDEKMPIDILRTSNQLVDII